MQARPETVHAQALTPPGMSGVRQMVLIAQRSAASTLCVRAAAGVGRLAGPWAAKGGLAQQ